MQELIKSNQMLVKLLQKNTPPSTIPAISPSVMMETPQEKLDRQKREHMQVNCQTNNLFLILF